MPDNFLPVHYPGTGNYIVANGKKLFRYDGNCLYFWDQSHHCEVAISKDAVMALTNQPPVMTAESLDRREMSRRQWEFKREILSK